MNTLLLAGLAAGGLLGVGAAVVVAGVVRWHPDLTDALALLDERLPHPTEPTSEPPARRGWLGRVLPARVLQGRVLQGRVLGAARRLPGAVDDADLDVLDLHRDRYLARALTTAVGYAAAGPVLAALLLVLDATLPVVVPAGFTLVGAVVGWTGHARRTRERADRARLELRYALVAYLHQVGLLRRGGAGVATALRVPAELLDRNWAMRRLRRELDLAERAGLMPWEGLRRFGAHIQVSELDDLSSIAATAGQDGGAVIDTVLARAEALNDELLADEHAAAHRASAQMSTPGAIQVFLIAAWVLYPAALALLNA